MLYKCKNKTKQRVFIQFDLYALFTAIVCLFIATFMQVFLLLKAGFVLRQCLISIHSTLQSRSIFPSSLQFVLLHQSSGIQCPFLFSGMVAALRNLYIVCSICVFALKLRDYVKAIIY